MIINRRTFGHKGVDVGYADHDLEAVRSSLRKLDLIKIARSIVVDRGPEQAAQIADILRSRDGGIVRLNGLPLLLSRGGKVRLEAVLNHDLPGHGLQITLLGLRIAHWLRTQSEELNIFRPCSRGAGVHAESVEHWRRGARDEQFWILAPSSRQSLQPCIPRGKIGRGRFRSAGGGA